LFRDEKNAYVLPWLAVAPFIPDLMLTTPASKYGCALPLNLAQFCGVFSRWFSLFIFCHENKK
jgi:hypothetical protein